MWFEHQDGHLFLLKRKNMHGNNVLEIMSMEIMSSMKLVIGAKKVGESSIKKSNCEIIAVMPPVARVRKIVSGPLPTLGIAGLSVVILLTRFTSPRGLEELLGFITILPQVQFLPRTRLQPLWRDKLMTVSCFHGKKISSPLSSTPGTIQLTPFTLSVCSLQWATVMCPQSPASQPSPPCWLHHPSAAGPALAWIT